MKLVKHIMFVIVLALSVVAQPVLTQTAAAETTSTEYFNGKIAFVSDKDHSAYEIYTMNPDGSDLTRLTDNTAYEGYALVWSPDGSQLAFTSERDGNPEIYIMDADGSNVVRVTNNPGYDSVSSWSPDGLRLAFTSDRDVGNYDIYTVNIDGSGIIRLTTDPQYDLIGFYSPDGEKILYSDSSSGCSQVFIMDTDDGANKTNISNTGGCRYTIPANWSRDGSRLAFITNRENPPSPFNSDLYTMNADGSDVLRLTNTLANEGEAVYSPDNSIIVGTGYADENYLLSELFTIDLDGSNKTDITSFGTLTFSPAWQALPYTKTVENDGMVTSTIDEESNYTETDYTVASNEALVLNGGLCGVVVESGGLLKGNGTACTIDVEAGGTIAPGQSPGCITSGDTTLSGAFEAELAGLTPCTQFDQLKVNGVVTAGGTLNVSLLSGFVPGAGSSFRIIDNDGADAVVGQFTGLPQGASLRVGTTDFTISYIGGDGNDVVLTAVNGATPALPGLPATGDNNNLSWSYLIGFVALVTTLIVLFTGSKQRAYIYNKK